MPFHDVIHGSGKAEDKITISAIMHMMGIEWGPLWTGQFSVFSAIFGWLEFGTVSRSLPSLWTRSLTMVELTMHSYIENQMLFV